MNLPRKYLSYSAFTLWKSDKERFRRKYYENDPSADIFTQEILFGKTIAKRLEDGDKIEGVISYGNPETKLEVEAIDGLKLLGYVDDFNEDDLSFVEYKTGRLSVDGKEPWSLLKARKHKQLVFYSLLIQLKYGKYNPDVKLQWLETEWDIKTYKGQVIEDGTGNLKLTGRVETYDRNVKEWELEKMKEEIIKVANEISEDYTQWQNQN